MKKIIFTLMTVCMVAFDASAQEAWREVANEMIFAEQPTYRNILLRNNKPEFSEVRVQVMSSGARIQRAEIVTDRGMSLPAWNLEGDYGSGMERIDLFQKSKVRAVRMYVTTLQPNEIVRVQIYMR